MEGRFCIGRDISTLNSETFTFITLDFMYMPMLKSVRPGSIFGNNITK